MAAQTSLSGGHPEGSATGANLRQTSSRVPRYPATTVRTGSTDHIRGSPTIQPSGSKRYSPMPIVEFRAVGSTVGRYTRVSAPETDLLLRRGTTLPWG